MIKLFIIFQISCFISSISLAGILNEKFILTIKPSDKIIPFTETNLENKFWFFHNDPQNLINEKFKSPPELFVHVNFWFNIYVLFNSDMIVIHDKEDLSLIYDIIDFSKLSQSELKQFTRLALKNQFISDQLKIYRDGLRRYNHKIRPRNLIESKIHSVLEKRFGKSSRKIRNKFLSQNIRAQTGQNDFITIGLEKIGPFIPLIFKMSDQLGVPKDVVTLSLLESSFNHLAVSKVGATGPWQIMQETGAHFLKIDDMLDHRLNPILSTLGAFHILLDNFKVVKNWPLSILAYNIGTGHIVNARRKLKKRTLTLQQFLSSYKHPNIGFASTNYISEFFALNYALQYQKIIFNQDSLHIPDVNDQKDINVYLSLCKIIPRKLFSNLHKTHPNLSRFNPHFLKPGRTYPRGSIIVSDAVLESKQFLQLTVNDLASLFPKNIHRLVGNHRCSIR